MSTGEKERKVISRAVRVLDEIESRIHELREELEQGGVATGRGRKAQRDESNETRDEGSDHEAHAQGRVKHPESDRRLKNNKNGHEDGGEGHDDNANDDQEPHAQGRVKHPESDRRLKNNKDGHDDGDHNEHAASQEHEPHAQGKVKHPETDKRLKANKD